MALIHLIYVSSATRLLDEEDLERILAVARDFNGRHGITGMLLYADGNFMQVLEGEEAVIDELMDKHIRLDTRHQHIFVIERTSIAQRDFPDWSMGFRRLDGGSPSQLAGFRTLFSLHGTPGNGIRPGIPLEILKQFIQP